MKKEAFVLIACVALICIFCKSTNAMIGISPGLYEVDFKPGLNQQFYFDFLGDQDMRFKIEAEGDLAQYVKIDQKVLNHPGRVFITLEMPDKIAVPGVHTIYISGKQVSNGLSGMSLLGNIKGIINVRVPYPEEYAVISVNPSNANAGKPVSIYVKIDSLGTNNVSAKTVINIYDVNNRSVSTIPFGIRNLGSLSSEEYKTQLNTQGYSPGFYKAEAVAEYGHGLTTRDSKPFRLGDLFVNMTGTSNDFERGRINRIDVNIESFWNDPIADVYAKISIINHTGINFETNHLSLDPFQPASLSGFFDTSGILEDNFDARIELNYNGKTGVYIVPLRFKENKSYLLYEIAAAALVLILAAIIIIVRRRRRNGKEIGKKKPKEKGKKRKE